MVFSAHLEFSKGSDPFEGKTFKRLPIKRRRDGLEYSANEDAEQEAVSEEDQSNYRLMCIIDGRDGDLLFHFLIINAYSSSNNHQETVPFRCAHITQGLSSCLLSCLAP